MATNPNPARISAEMWRFWEEFKKIEPTVQLGGIYANKPGYHNTRDANPSYDYSEQYALDKLGPGDKAAAIDLTFPDAHSGDYKTIDKYSSRLLASGQDPVDDRGNYMREFYGQADNDLGVEGWDYQRVGPASSDSSHLWHIHISFMRAYLNNREAFDAVLSILRGESYGSWKARNSSTHIYIEGVGLATVADVAKAVWEHQLNDMIQSRAQGKAVNSSAGNQLRYARTDSFLASHDSSGKAYYVNDVINDIKALLA